MTADDKRVVKTKASIREGFRLCIVDKPFSKITVNDICEAGQVNRSTFYKYYVDKYDLREKLVKQTINEFDHNIALGSFQLGGPPRSLQNESLVSRLEAIFAGREWYLAVWSDHMEPSIFSEMVRVVDGKMRDIENHREYSAFHISSDSKKELLARLVSSTTLTTIRWWLEYSPDTSAKQVADYVENIIMYGIRKTFAQ